MNESRLMKKIYRANVVRDGREGKRRCRKSYANKIGVKLKNGSNLKCPKPTSSSEKHLKIVQYGDLASLYTLLGNRPVSEKELDGQQRSEQEDRDSNLTVPARWEDRNLRNYLNKPDVERTERWIGGIYDYITKSWKWGGELRPMRYQSFSRMKKLTPEQLQWHCIAMAPDLLYSEPVQGRKGDGRKAVTHDARSADPEIGIQSEIPFGSAVKRKWRFINMGWAPQSCIEPRQYICQTKLRKLPKAKVSELRRRWQKMGKTNEITAPSVSLETNDPTLNDVTLNPLHNPKSYDLRPSPLRLGPTPNSLLHPNQIRGNTKNYDLHPNEIRKRDRPRPTVRHRLTLPFPGYSWNRRDPEGSYRYNENILRSGRTGLSQQQIDHHLRRLARVRNKQIARRKRLRDNGDWLVDEPKRSLPKAHVKTYTLNNNISSLHPKTIVEEFDMIPPPAIALPRPARGAG
ncbi:hypothetical protein EVAR_23534_1 [Eumeta japonica]|uniref:Uncharacterized protein n=1 Tax=Eumeta variegata TaxID=151549 RepID=A0A4C1W180_EUMVA|nr:hypothetical protein EVAR_23534_1 [Eumeta japonica]